MYDAPEILRQILASAVRSVHPDRVVRPALPPCPAGRVVVTGAGKAAAAMAYAVEQAWDRPLEGEVVTRYGHGAPTRFIQVREARHPIPDSAGLTSAVHALQVASGLNETDTLLVLLSGGGSALWSAPLAPLSLSDKQSVTKALVLSGATIAEINCVRKHLSAIKGGRLAAAAYPARVITLAISDVTSDDPSVIASGPTVGDETTQADALEILRRYNVPLSDAVRRVLSDPLAESVKPSDARLSKSEYRLIARGGDALSAACDAAHGLGIDTQVLGVRVEGDARRVGLMHGEIARHHDMLARPLLLLSGGELTVSVRGSGQGGPNREYLLGLLAALHGCDGVWALAADTDGIDGSDEAAGGWIGPDTLGRARQLGLDLAQCVNDNDSARFFRTLGQEIISGPTRTNVNDLRAILILPKNQDR